MLTRLILPAIVSWDFHSLLAIRGSSFSFLRLFAPKWRKALSGKTHDIPFISENICVIFRYLHHLKLEGKTVFDRNTIFSKQVTLHFSCPLDNEYKCGKVDYK